VVDSVTKPPTAQRREPRLGNSFSSATRRELIAVFHLHEKTFISVTTAVEKDTFPETAVRTLKPKPATSVVKKVISRANVRNPARLVVVVVEVVEEVVKNATSAGRLVTLLAPAPSQLVTEAATTTAVTAVEVAVVAVAAAADTALLGAERLATLVVVLVTFPVTACKVPSVTTVPDSVTSARIVPSPRGVLVIRVVRKDTSLVTAPARAQKGDSYYSSSTLLVPYFSSMISSA